MNIRAIYVCAASSPNVIECLQSARHFHSITGFVMALSAVAACEAYALADTPTSDYTNVEPDLF